MGQYVTCNKCRFRFDGGHDHHSGSSSCVCLSCLSYFSCPTKSEWGPEIGEEIEICRLQITGKRKKKKYKLIPTGACFKTEQGESFQLGNETSYYVIYPIETVPCPDCNATKLSLGFEQGDTCPKCQKGSIQTEPRIY